MTPRRLKRVVIKEELVELTGNAIEALILQQHLFWNERTKDFDSFLQEEIERAKQVQQPADQLAKALTDGWVYKSRDQLHEELMLEGIVAPRTLAKHIETVIEKGYLLRRHNPKNPWDRTWQYRPDLLKLIVDLDKLGYHLDGYADRSSLDEVTDAALAGADQCNRDSRPMERQPRPMGWPPRPIKIVQAANVKMQMWPMIQRLLQRLEQRLQQRLRQSSWARR